MPKWFLSKNDGGEKMALRGPPLSGREKQNFFDFLFFIDKYTLKCPLSICGKNAVFHNV
jgi:hypothetical protein